MRASEPCPDPTCPHLKPCPVHRRVRSPEQQRRSNHLYGNRTYKRARARALKRDGYRCRWPGCPVTVGVQAHHVTKANAGGRHHEDNLVTLCPAHHKVAERLGSIPA